MKLAITAMLLIGLLAAPASAEFILLKTGWEIEGEIEEIGLDFIRVKRNDELLKIPFTRVDEEALKELLEAAAPEVKTDVPSEGPDADFQKFYELGSVKLQEGANEDALVYFKRAKDIKPKDFGINFILGSVFINEQDAEQALPHLKTAVEVNPENVDAQYLCGIALRMNGKPEEALKYMKDAFELAPSSYPVCFELAQTLASADQLTAAIDQLKKAQVLQPYNPDVYWAFGTFYRLDGQYEKARQNMSRARELLEKLIDDPENYAALEFYNANEWMLVWGYKQMEYMDKSHRIVVGFLSFLAKEREDLVTTMVKDRPGFAKKSLIEIAEFQKKFDELKPTEDFESHYNRLRAVLYHGRKSREAMMVEGQDEKVNEHALKQYEAFNSCIQYLVKALLENDMPKELIDENMKKWKEYIDSLIEELKEDDRYWFGVNI